MSSTTAIHPISDINVKQGVDSFSEAEVQELENYLSVIRSQRVLHERQWLTNLAFYKGKHYSIWVTQGGAQTLVNTNASPHRVRMVVNKCKVVVRTEIAKLIKEKPRGYVVPNTSDDADKAASRHALRLYESLEKPTALGIQREMRQAVFWLSITGNGFLKTFYDKSAKDFTGKPGAITVIAKNPFAIYVPNLEEPEIERQDYVIDVMTKTTKWVKQVFGVEIQSDSTAASNIGVSTRVLNTMDLREMQDADRVKVKEIWMKPCAKYPKGMMAIWAGGKVLFKTESWPYEHEQYPYTKIDHIPTGSFYNDSTLVDYIPVQKEYNRSVSQVIESRNLMSKPQWKAQKGSIDPNKMTSEPGTIIEYLPGMQPPEMVTPPGLPGYIENLMQRTQGDMNDISSQHEISHGSAPTGVTAGTAISFLQEDDDSKLSTTITSMEEACQKVGGQVLSLVSQYWTVGRQITITGKSDTVETMEFSKATLRGNTDYRIESGSAAPRSRAGKQAFLLELMGAQYISPQQGLKWMDMQETSDFYDDAQKDAIQAQKELLKFIADPKYVLTIHMWDNDIEHIESHANFMKTEQFELLKPEQKMAIEDHLKAHKIHVAASYGRMDLVPQVIVDPQTGQPIIDPNTGKPHTSPYNPQLDGYVEGIKVHGPPPPMPPAPPPAPGEINAQPQG